MSELLPETSQRQAADPAASAWVDASAGSGKTKVLTDRILRLLLNGVAPDAILAITFTKAAAAEMRNRLTGILAKWATMPNQQLDAELDKLYGEGPRDKDARTKARRLFTSIVDAAIGVRIETIHGFCQSVLRRFPLEAGIMPHFEVLDERSAEKLRKDSVAAVLAHAAGEERLGGTIARLSVAYAETRFAELIGEIIKDRARLERVFAAHGGVEEIVAALERANGIEPGASVEAQLRQSCHDLAIEKELLHIAAKVMQEKGTATYIDTGRRLQGWLECDIEGRCASFESYSAVFLTNGEIRKNLVNPKLAKEHPEVEASLQREAERVQALLARCKTLAVLRNTEDFLILGHAILGEYRTRKLWVALLDFDDQILLTRDLLTGSQGAAAWVLYKLDSGLEHILVDESQDTSPVQWDLIKALTEEFFAGAGAQSKTRTIFAVGDRKQSIFSFQGADPATFQEVRSHFQQAVDDAAMTWHSVELNISFRSTQPILSLVDAVFSEGAALQGIAEEALTHHLFRRGEGGLVEVWPLAEKAPKSEDDVWAIDTATTRVDDPATRTANRIADTIAGWLKNKERLVSQNRSIRPSDIMVLVRKRWPLTPKLISACKQRGIPVAGADRMVLTGELAVQDLMALAAFLLLPDDNMTLAIVLRGPLLNLSEEDLFRLAHGRPGTLYEALREAEFPAAVVCREWLEAWLDKVDYTRPYELFAAILNQGCPADPVGSGRRAFAARLGPEAEDPLDEFLGATLKFEATHAPSLQSFLTWIETKEVEIKREKHTQESGHDADNAAGEVAIMTVHGAKGLQAPIVFLADSTDVKTGGAGGPMILWRDDGLPLAAPKREAEDAACRAVRETETARAEDEYRRLLYVALTRAKDRLYVASWQGRNAPPETCWHNLIAQALPRLPHARALAEGGWRLEEPQTRKHDQAATAQTVPRQEALPAFLRLNPPPETSPPRPLAPSHFIAEDPKVASPLFEGDRSSRFERGRLIHRLLQTLPDVPEGERVAAAQRYLKGASSLSEEQANEMIAEIIRVMDDTRFAAVFGPHSQAEVPVVGLIDKTFALSGQIDRLVVTEAEVLIVDYKTNRPPPTAGGAIPKAYLQQLAAYRAAITALYPGRQVRTALLWTYGPYLTEVVP